MPHPSAHHNGANVYADSPSALLDRGLDLSAEDLALKSIADTHAAHAPQPTPSHDQSHADDHDKDGQSDREREASQSRVSETPRIAALAAQLPSEGLQTLFDCCSRISSILLSLSSAVQDTPASSTTNRRAGPQNAPTPGTSTPPAPPSPDEDHADPQQPSQATATADSAPSDHDSSKHGTSDAGEAGTGAPPAHGRSANMRKMAEQLLNDRDRASRHPPPQPGALLGS